jgi:hypothetical protein
LITIDPVGSGKEMINSIRNNCIVWVDVNVQSSSWFNLSNIAAEVGGRWDDAPKGVATFYIEAPINHERFSQLMNYPGEGGETVIMILERYRASAR